MVEPPLGAWMKVKVDDRKAAAGFEAAPIVALVVVDALPLRVFAAAFAQRLGQHRSGHHAIKVAVVMNAEAA